MTNPFPIDDLFPYDPREATLDQRSAALIENIRSSMAIHSEMIRRVLLTMPEPSLLLAELLEDAGNRYIDLSEIVSGACKDGCLLREKVRRVLRD